MTKEDFLKELSNELVKMEKLPHFMNFIINNGIRKNFDCIDLVENLHDMAEECIEDKKCTTELMNAKITYSEMIAKNLTNIIPEMYQDDSFTLTTFFKMMMVEKIKSDIERSASFLKHFFILSLADYIRQINTTINIDFSKMLEDIKKLSNNECKDIYFDDFIDSHIVNTEVSENESEEKDLNDEKYSQLFNKILESLNNESSIEKAKEDRLEELKLLLKILYGAN